MIPQFYFIRTGKRPVSQMDSEFIIRGCFAHCDDTIRATLDDFFKSQRQSVTFRFEDCQVTIERR